MMKFDVFFKVSLFWYIGSTYLVPITVNSQDYRVVINHSEKSYWLKVIDEDGLDFFSIQEFAELLNLRTYYSEKTKKTILYIGNQEVTFSALNPYVLIGSKTRQLPTDTRYLSNDIFIPLKFFVQLSEDFNGLQLDLDEINHQLDISIDGSRHRDFNIHGLSIQDKINGTLIRVATTKDFKDSDISTRLRHDWVYVDIYGGKVDSLSLSHSIPIGIVSEIIPLQLTENLAQLSFKVNHSIGNVKAYVNHGKNEILVKLENELTENILKELERERQKWQIDKIMIDPGHGGKDPGAIGPRGVYEKDVVLGIALYLRELLKDNLNVEVFMTRERDTFVPLAERTAMANRLGAKLFISIHANSNLNRRVNGTSTYILGLAQSQEAIDVAQRENSVIRLEDSQELYRNLDSEQFILSSIAQSQFNRESEELAALLQAEVHKKTKLADRGVRQAGYYVLIGASMPNVLFETAFISNRKEEKFLNSPEFQQKIAEGIYQSIKKFKLKYEQIGQILDYGQNNE